MRAGTYIGLSRRTVMKLAKSGELSSIRFGRRVLIDRENLDRWIERQKHPAGQ